MVLGGASLGGGIAMDFAVAHPQAPRSPLSPVLRGADRDGFAKDLVAVGSASELFDVRFVET